MELQTYINNNADYLASLRLQGVRVNSFKRMKIISYPYAKASLTTSMDEPWKMFIRGAVVSPENKIICLGPCKSAPMNEYPTEDDGEKISYEHLIDGTMINLFHYNGEWLISTRSDIGGYNKWDNKKSFRQMFDECSKLHYESLDKNMSYSFVMRHMENRNVSPIKDNELFLCEVYDYSGDTIRRLDRSEYPENNYSENESYTNKDEFMKMYQGPCIHYATKGYTIKVGSRRFKWINPYFEEVKALKINMNNHLMNYIELRRNGQLKKYLRYFPEHQHIFNNYQEKIHSISNELHTTYKNVFVHKTIERDTISFHLKPLIYDIHGLYLETKEPTSWSIVKDYIHTVPTKKLVFALNHVPKKDTSVAIPSDP